MIHYSELGQTSATADGTEFGEKVKDENNFIYYKCRFCGLTYNYINTLRAHERVHDVDRPYKCSKCSEAFHFMCELEYHAKQHSGYKCECGRTFHNYTDLLYHEHIGEQTHNQQQEQQPEPAVAYQKSTSRIPESEFPAPDYAIKGYEPKHPLKVYSDVRLKPYICQYCSKSYADSRGLTQHMYSHRGEKIFNPRACRYLMGRSDSSFLSAMI
uniref:Zinc finger protein unc-98 n=1 Tax=Syphacia muris TaxID=451379 RepID=A0A0N5AEA1_9BILA